MCPDVLDEIIEIGLSLGCQPALLLLSPVSSAFRYRPLHTFWKHIRRQWEVRKNPWGEGQWANAAHVGDGEVKERTESE